MEYKIVSLPALKSKAELILNSLAKMGWRVICALTVDQVIMGREIE